MSGKPFFYLFFSVPVTKPCLFVWLIFSIRICGTSEYLPPEIILRTRYGASVDWWTFGIVLFEMLFGEHPFYSEDKETLYTNILYKTIDFPPNCSPEAKSLLQGVCFFFLGLFSPIIAFIFLFFIFF